MRIQAIPFEIRKIFPDFGILKSSENPGKTPEFRIFFGILSPFFPDYLGGFGAEGARNFWNFEVKNGDFDDFLCKIDDFEVQILEIFSPAAGLP